jgi:hypothetical protein
LRRNDAAAWLSTDALKAIRAFDEIPGTAMGWLTREVGDAIEITYFAKVDGEPRGYAEARLELSGYKISNARRLPQPRAADARELRFLRALDTAMAAPRIQCSKSLNTVVFEEEGLHQIRVYIFSAWDDPKLMPMGGHSRFSISSDGAHILDTLQQTKVL